MFFEMLLNKDFYRLFLRSVERNNIIEYKLSDIIYVGKNFKRTLTNNNIPEIFKKIQQLKKRIYALSSGFRSTQKACQITNLGINFDRLFFTKREQKGIYLKNIFEKEYEYFELITGKKISDIKILVIDNHLYKLDNIKTCLSSLQISLVLYKNDYIPQITVPEFQNYWRDVIDSMHGFRKTPKKPKQ